MSAVVAATFGASVFAGLIAAAAVISTAPPGGYDVQDWPMRWPKVARAAARYVHGRLVRAVLLALAWFLIVTAGGWAAGIASGLGPAPVALPGDHPVLSWFTGRRSAAVTAAVRAVTWLGDTIVLLSLVVVSGLAWRWQRGSWRGLTVGLGAYAGAAASFNILKRVIDRPRPSASLALLEPAGSAYPSGHAVDAAAVYLALVVIAGWALRRKALALVAGAAAGVVTLVAISRLYLGVHWLSDVVAGVIMGVSWTLGLTTVVAGFLTDASSARRGPSGGGDPDHRASASGDPSTPPV